jgi:hypothetical protein
MQKIGNIDDGWNFPGYFGSFRMFIYWPLNIKWNVTVQTKQRCHSRESGNPAVL